MVKIFLYNNLVDERWGADRLAHIVKKEMDFEPRSGGVFIFFNKAKTRAKIYFYDGTGTCLLTKRLEKGFFHMPKSKSKSITIDASKLALLLDGCVIDEIRKPVP
ncbi:MAG: IS66 family insertion sequence element accessory protein TnpB [Oligoflexales bacterium]